MKQIIFFFIFTILAYAGYSQQIKLSPQAEISIITVDQGKELNDTWGHSAIRVLDKTNHIDQVYNYGVYDFDTPNFYTKFARGKLLYDLGSYPFHYFLKSYIKQNRAVIEQILQLTLIQKQEYFDFLENNAKPENKKYLYDFFFDNCATKLRDVTTEVLGDSVNYQDELLQDTFTFRDLIYQKLEYHPWGTFGIDLALGSVIDKKATPKQYTFLPEYVFKGFENVMILQNGKEVPLVKRTTILYEQKEEMVQKSFFTPLFLFSIIAFLVLWITNHDHKKKKRTKWLDFLLFFTTGITGLIILLLWFATDHSATANNYNIFWAFLPNLFLAFPLLKTALKPWHKKYILFLILLLVLTVILWIVKIQIFSVGLIPILVLLAVRYAFLYRYNIKN